MATYKKRLYGTRLDKAIEELDNNVYVVEENGKKVKDPKAAEIAGNQLKTRLEKSSSFPTTSKSYVSTKKDDDENKWFKSGAFDDGYDFGDITKTILGTTGDVGVGVFKGIFNLAEGIVDLGRYGVSGAANLLGADKYAEDVKERARQNTTEDLFGGLEGWVDQYSVLGNKSDNITQGLGYIGGIIGTAGLGSAAGLGTAGTTALTTGTTFTSSMGSGMGEAYDSGATDKEAVTYGAIKGAGDAVTELIFGGLGKGINAVGLSKGLSSADDMLAKGLSSKINNQIAKNFVQFGVKAGAEGTEEVLAGIVSAAGKKLTYMSEEDLGKLIEDEQLLEQFVAGAITSGIAQSGFVPGMTQGSLVEANKTGRDFVSGYTQNEQTVIDSLVNEHTDTIKRQNTLENELNKAITGKETEQGGILSEKEKNALREQINAKIDNGEIDISSTKLKNKEISAIREIVEEQMQKGQLDTNKIESILGTTITENDGILARSYQETARKGENFTYEQEKVTNEQEKAVYDSAAKYFNNTTRSHEFVEKVAKIAKDKGTKYGFINNEELKSLGHDVEGKQVNGLVRTNKDGEQTVLINIDSPKALNTIVGHETTHLLEGTQEYQDLQEAIFNYAKEKGDYNGRLDSLNSLYEGIDNANIDAELTADLVGDYLFTDSEFINSLSTNKPTVFQKIKELIDDLVVRFTGTKEEKALREVQKKFKEAYRKNATQTDTDTKYSFAGEKGARNSKKALSRLEIAKRLAQEGYTNEETRKKTGWFKGTDGQWRIEISDRDSRIIKKVEANNTYKLGEILKHDKLFEAYPELKDYKVKFKDMKSNGAFNQITSGISISNRLANDLDSLKGTLMHEVQHAIQKREGFARGTYYDTKNAENYRNSAGEQEARDVKRRLDYSKEDVRDIAPVMSKRDSNRLHEVGLFSKRIATDQNIKYSVSDNKGVHYGDLGKGRDTYYWNINSSRRSTGHFGTGTYFVSETEASRLENSSTFTRKDRTKHEVNFDDYNLYKPLIEPEARRLHNGLKAINYGEYDSFGVDILKDDLKRNGISEEQFNKAIEKVKEVRADYEKKGYDNDYKGQYDSLSTIFIKELGFNGIDVRGLEGYDNTGYGSVIYDLDNKKSDADIRYSLSEDSQGNELKPAVQKWAENSKARDENGNLKVLYHGTATGEFTVFDKNKANPEGDWGAGFYLTDNEYDVETNYKDGGADFDNRVSRLAEQIWNEEGIEYEEAETKAREQLYKGSYKITSYVNMENPAIVGETYILDGETTYDVKDLDDYDGDLEGYYQDLIYDITEDIQYNVEVDGDIESLSNVLYEAVYDGGIEIQQLKEKINGLYLTDYDGNMVGNEVAREILEYLGYDGIIDPTVSGKWRNMSMESGTTHYIAFKPNQIKNVTNENPTDNPDINMSLSNPNEDIAPTGDYNVYGEDVKLAIAPLQEEIKELTESIKDIKVNLEAFKQDAPVKEVEYTQPSKAELDNLMALQETGGTEYANTFFGLRDKYGQRKLYKGINEYKKAPETYEAPIKGDEFAALTEADLPMLEQQYEEDFRNIDESSMPMETDENIPDIEMSDTKSLFETRDYEDVGSRKVNAYQYDNPEVKPYFQEAATSMLGDLKNSIKGERGYNDNLYYESGGEEGFYGVSRQTTDDIAELLDGMGGKYKYTYADIEKGLNAIINDEGSENNAVSKRIEFYLDQRLREGYTDMLGYEIPANQDYINLLKAREFDDFYNSLPIDDSMMPVENVDNFVDKVSNSNIAEKIAPVKEEYLAITPEKEPKMKRVKENPTYNEIAEILTEEPKTESDRNKRKWAIFKANVLDKGMVFEDLALKENNRELIAKWDYTLTSEARGQYAIGKGHNGLSKSLDAIRQEVDNTGLTKDFYNYMYHKHNVDRMSLATRFEGMENKPVFGDSVTAEISQNIVNQYENQHPEFMDFAQDVYDYVNADKQLLVDNGVISQETADLWSEMYPHYVPTRRTTDTGIDINVPLDTMKTGINSPIKKATGGSADILPLFDTMAMRTLQTYRATAKNSFGVELMNTMGTTIESAETNVDEVIDSIDAQDGLLQEGKKGKNPTFTVFDGGEKTTFEITKDMYDALKPVSESSFLSKTIKPLNVAGNIRRGLLTEYNPVFMFTNAIKDTQDILLNSQHSLKTYAKIPEAHKQLITKGYWYEEYIKNGGEQNSYFDNDTNTFKTENKGINKILDIPPLSTISKVNNYIEMIPRLAEYIASRESGASIEVAMLDAARVTTNFKAGGAVTKFANRNGATFLNASVQGAMQQVRNIREAKANGVRGWVNLAAKATMAALPAILLNNLVWEDDEEYEELSDYVKQNYYIVGKTEDGTFIRIPKGRAVAVIQDAVKQMENLVTGDDEADLKSFIELTINNLAPNNPLDNNIFSPITQVATNKTWYGGDLVPTRLQDLPAAEQYDESTDEFSKWIGKVFNVSPYKVNYLLDQYSGGVGDVLLPMMTPEATSDADTLGEQLLAPLKSKFTTNSTMNNQNISDFYDAIEELATNAKKSDATDNDVLSNKYINSVRAEMNELYKEKREIQNSDLSKKEKYEQVLDIQSQINELAENALSEYSNVRNASNYSTVGDREYYKRINEDGEVEWTKVNGDEAEDLSNLGLTHSEKNTYFKTKSEISSIVEEYKDNKSGLDEDSDEYKNIVSELSSEKKANIVSIIKDTGFTDEQKAYLYKKYYNSDTIDTIVSSGISVDAYLDYSTQDIKADKDKDGDSIPNSRKKKVIAYVNGLDLSIPEKAILIKATNTFKFNDYNKQIIEYVSGLDISYDEQVSILEELDMKVLSDGRVIWE